MKKYTVTSIVISVFLFHVHLLVTVEAAVKESILKTIESVQVSGYGQGYKHQHELERLINESHKDSDMRTFLEDQILSALQSENTTLAAKNFFCLKLAYSGSEASIPILGQLLLDNTTTEIACNALKTNPSSKVDGYLRHALIKLKGTSRFAVIKLLGDRRDEKAVVSLVGTSVFGDDLMVSKAAVSALGQIGSSYSAKVISNFRANNPTFMKFDFADAYLQSAYMLKKDGDIDNAVAIFKELSQSCEPSVVQRGARHNLLDLGQLDIDFDKIEPISLFDGHSFNGWQGNQDFFRIENGAIVAGNLNEKIPRNEFLCTDKDYSNFELRLKCKISAKDANAGIQIRSRRVANSHEMWGYQADMGQNYWGNLYDESRRRITLAESNNSELSSVLKETGWNDYVIRCMGRRVQLWINGYQTVDYLEPDESIHQAGLIGVQIHSGPPAEARYKDIEIRIIDQSLIY